MYDREMWRDRLELMRMWNKEACFDKRQNTDVCHDVLFFKNACTELLRNLANRVQVVRHKSNTTVYRPVSFEANIGELRLNVVWLMDDSIKVYKFQEKSSSKKWEK